MKAVAEAVRPPVDWSRVERVRVGGVTRFVMVSAETSLVMYGYLLRRTTDGDLDFATVPGEDESSRTLVLLGKDTVTKRTRLRQDHHTAEWVDR